MKIKYTIAFYLLLATVVQAQTNTVSTPSVDRNYILTRTYLSSDGKFIDQVQYFDGLGRPEQTVQVGITPQKKDLVTIQTYDLLGREDENWLPGTSSGNGAYVNPIVIQKDIISLNLNDQKPFSKLVYEESPLNRVLEHYGPGNDWQTKKKSIKIAYEANISGIVTMNCILYSINGTRDNFTLLKSGNYPTGKLYATRTSDENGNISYEFKNKLEQVVLTRQVSDGVNYDTYYVYDDYGNLCFVLPPRIQDEGISQTKLDELAYQYKYDYRNRCIWKKLPGCEPIYYVYNNADQLIFTQDGEQRKRNANEWEIIIYDIFGRVAMTGIIDDFSFYLDDVIGSGTVEHVFVSPSIKECVKVGQISFYAKYTNNASNFGYDFELHDCDILALLSTSEYVFKINSSIKYTTINYYDNYNFLAKNGFPNQIYDNAKESAGFGKRYNEGKGYEAKGQLTGTIVATLGGISEQYLYSTMYYDNRGRLIQTKSTNHLGGNEIEYIAYNFTGQPTKKLHTHSSGNNALKQELYTYTYDHAGRPIETNHQLDNASPVVLAKNEYDELGRLKVLKRVNNEKLRTEYTYNIRSWMKWIMNPLFTQYLYYNEQIAGNVPNYNGNISFIEWKNSDIFKSYYFLYDALSQLKTANYVGTGQYSTSYSYDKHGNMLTLQRKGKTNSGYGVVDQLTMSYKGNQLTNVKDAGENVAIGQSADFKDYSNGKGVYEYNNNGAMTKDLHKGISKIEYNSLNLPMLMDIKSPVAEARNEYLYSATGLKLRVKQRWNNNFSTTPIIGTGVNQSALDIEKVTDYVGNKIYEDGKLVKILVDGGYYDVEQKKYYFYIQDHLGNNRVVADAQGNVIQRSDYYPFGMEFADNTNPDEQPYKYNGKELDKQHGLNMYDYSARYMEPAIGRFTSVDPHAESYYNLSPYVYVANNPILAIDPSGMDIYWFDEEDGMYRNKSKQDGTHRMAMTSKDKNGNLHIQFYDFADPENDPADIDNGIINRFEMLEDSDVSNIIAGEGGFDMSNSPLGVFAIKSSGGGSFDYSMGGAMRKYMKSKGREEMLNSSLYIARGDTYAHNKMNFGNFLWGATGYSLWYSRNVLLKAADLNSRYGVRNGYESQPDSTDDQLSITRGTEFAKDKLYRYKVKHTWLGKLLGL